jgi:hypothetical protein
MGAAAVDPQRRLLADEDPDGVGGDAGTLQVRDRGVDGRGGGGTPIRWSVG